jgi:hypothetical protein
MKLKLLWTSTNDHLFFDVINEELTTWFINTTQQLGNQYSPGNMVTDDARRAHDTNKFVDELSNDVDRVNKFLISMKQPPVAKPNNWCDQQQLNALHKGWAQTRFDWPKLSSMLYKIDTTLFDSYHRMNCHIHVIETSFRYAFRDPTHWRVDNPFKDVPYDWEECHLSLKYPGHGREAFEKFKTCDDDDSDLCNWDNIDGALTINLTRPYKITPPAEFLEWCKFKNLVPHTDTIPLGNLVDWATNLTNARGIFLKNMKIPGNYFSLSVV